MVKPKNKRVELLLSPEMYDRLVKVHKELRGGYHVNKFINKWMADHFENCATLIQEECGLANKAFYAQKTVPGEDINKPQTQFVEYKKYVPPVYVDGADPLCFTDDIANRLGILEYKQRGRHIVWRCCSCNHCQNYYDDYDPDPCACHKECVCWCNNVHCEHRSFKKDDVQYKLSVEIPDRKCPGHRECT